MAYNNLGAEYSNQGYSKTALEYYQKALRIQSQILGDNHSDVATSYNNIGYEYSKQGNSDKALEYLQRALNIQLKVLGEKHPSVAISYNNIGAEYSNQGHREKAIEYYEKALNIQLQILGDNHLDVAGTYNNIGNEFYYLGNASEALKYYQKCLEIQIRLLGDNHSNVAATYGSISMAYMSSSKYEQAMESIKMCLNIKPEYSDKRICQNIQSSCLSHLYQSNPSQWQSEYEAFFSTHMHIGTIVSNGPAASRGMEGTYYVMKFEDWDAEQEGDLFEVNERLKGKEKAIVVYRNGEFRQETFDDTIGMQLGLKAVTKTEHDTLLKAWQEWKNGK